jgi:hypothetical protein
MFSVPDLTSITIVTVTFDDLVEWNNEVYDKSNDEENVQNVSCIQLRRTRPEQIFSSMFNEE